MRIFIVSLCAMFLGQPGYAGLCVDPADRAFECGDKSEVDDVVFVRVKNDDDHYLYFETLEDMLKFREIGLTPPPNYHPDHGSVNDDHVPDGGVQILSLGELIKKGSKDPEVFTEYRKKKGKGGMVLAMIEGAAKGAGAFVDGARQMAVDAGYTEMKMVLENKDGGELEITWDLEKDDISLEIKSPETVAKEKAKAKEGQQSGGGGASVNPNINARDPYALARIISDRNRSLPYGTITIIDHDRAMQKYHN
jgi:hypothetical protein